jgi:exosortase A
MIMDNPGFTSSQISRLIFIASIVVFVGLTYWISFSSLVELWQLSDHAYGVVVFPISAFLIWRLRHEITGVEVAPEPRGIIVVLPLLVGWLGSRLAGIQATEHAIVLAMIPATLYALAGSKLTHKLLFPMLFILFATPISDSLVPHLMLITADVSSALLRISGLTVFREGQYISLPGGTFVVADVCSGVRYLTTGVMLALLFSYLTYQSALKRLAFVTLTGVALVLANGIRAYIVMAIASATEFQYLGGRDHIYFGWALFGIVIMLIMWAGTKYADAEHDVSTDMANDESAVHSRSRLPLIVALGLIMLAVTVKPLHADLGNTGMYVLVAVVALGGVLLTGWRRAGSVIEDLSGAWMDAGRDWRAVGTGLVTVSLLLSAPVAVEYIEGTTSREIAPPKLESLVTCIDPKPWQNRWAPKMTDPDYQSSMTFVCSGQPVSVYIAGYASTLQGKELISSSNQLLPLNWDRYSEASKVRASTEGERMEEINEVVINGPDYHGLIWYWYQVDGHVATTPLTAKFWQVAVLVLRRPAGGRVVVMETPVIDNVDEARRRLESAASGLLGHARSASSED